MSVDDGNIRAGEELTAPQEHQLAPNYGPAILLALLAFALVVRIVAHANLDMHFDEWFHVLTGLSLAQDGTFTFINGEYTRTPLFTALVSGAMQVFPFEPAVSARIPSIVFGLIALALFYRLATMLAQSGTAIVATLLLAADQLVVDWSVYTRFYSVQMACFLFAILATEIAFRSPHWSKLRMVATGLAVILAALLAISFQMTSIVPLGGYFAFRLLATKQIRDLAIANPRPSFMLAGLAIVATIVVGVLIGPKLWEVLRYADTWAIPYQNELFFYEDRMRWSYAVFWPMTPIAMIIALRFRPYATFLSLAIIVPVFFVQSIGGMKALRYVLPAIPFITLIWAIALYEVGRFAQAKLANMIEGLKLLPASSRVPSVVSLLAVFLALCWAAIGNDAYRNSVKDTARTLPSIIAMPSQLFEVPVQNEWRDESAKLDALITPNTFLITNSHQQMAYFVREPNARLATTASYKTGFLWFDPKTGLLQIGHERELEAIRECYAEGLVAIPNYALRNSREVARFVSPLDRLAERVSGFDEFTVWQWRDARSDRSESCEAIPERVTEILNGAA